MARYNLLRGLAPPASGHWHNNPDADDIDFQIEADFIGLMSPGLPRRRGRPRRSRRPHHELRRRLVRRRVRGDDVLAGVRRATTCKAIVTESLKAIPAGTRFRQTIDARHRPAREVPGRLEARLVRDPEAVGRGHRLRRGRVRGLQHRRAAQRRLRRARPALRQRRLDAAPSPSRPAPARTPTATRRRRPASSARCSATRRSRPTGRRGWRRSRRSRFRSPACR